ncbi:PD-(D/E)XK nuclease family protein [Aggregatibacter aphrophilus]|jgi:genome|uniref:PDDEXK-like family protein n=1 Tax=Aggregatibacter aphrophilus TaxID=732 RepID=UPI000D646897|nr:PD-(D/E)XK nuclease family protein [Aggregatibacter aphrophilus]
MANNINQVVDSLISIGQVIENFRLQREKTELYDSNRFNPFQFMRTDEMGLSKILAFLLDPKEAHGQGDLFLNSFLKYIGKHNFLAYDNIQVSVEKATSKNRRHDIFIEGFLNNKRRWIVSIENKLRFASDQEEQLKDYRDDLEKYRETEYYLIYLPVFKEPPSGNSIRKNEWEALISERKAILLSAKDLVDWLDNTLIIAPAVKQFCQNFKKFLNEELMGNTETSNDLVHYLMENNEALYSALNIIDSGKQLHESLIEVLVKQLQKRFESNYKKLRDYGWRCNSNGDINTKYFGIYIDQGNISWGIGVEFDATNLRDGYYGVYCHKDEYEKLYNLIGELFDNAGLRFRGKPTRAWPIWQWIGGKLQNWDSEILKKIPNGELADQIFDLWEPLLSVITDNLDEIKKLDINKS